MNDMPVACQNRDRPRRVAKDRIKKRLLRRRAETQVLLPAPKQRDDRMIVPFVLLAGKR
jgi:hypothetical protein